MAFRFPLPLHKSTQKIWRPTAFSISQQPSASSSPTILSSLTPCTQTSLYTSATSRRTTYSTKWPLYSSPWLCWETGNPTEYAQAASSTAHGQGDVQKKRQMTPRVETSEEIYLSEARYLRAMGTIDSATKADVRKT